MFALGLFRWISGGVCWFFVGDFGFYEFAPSADAVVGLDVAVGVFNEVGFEDFLKVQRFKVAGGVDDGSAFHSERVVVGSKSTKTVTHNLCGLYE